MTYGHAERTLGVTALSPACGGTLGRGSDGLQGLAVQEAP